MKIRNIIIPTKIRVSFQSNSIPDPFSMIPFMMTAEPNSEFSFKSHTIMCVADTNEQVSDAYLESTTGIKPVRNSSSIIV
jgi:hypothetical protein